MSQMKCKPYKLKPTNGALSRDDVSVWEYTMLAACRQEPDWLKFLPGGENHEWAATNDDQFNGLQHNVPATQTKFRARLYDSQRLLYAGSSSYW